MDLDLYPPGASPHGSPGNKTSRWNAQFDVITGKMISGMVELSLPGMDKALQEIQDAMNAIGEMTSHIRTNNLQLYPVEIKGKRVFVPV